MAYFFGGIAILVIVVSFFFFDDSSKQREDISGALEAQLGVVIMVVGLASDGLAAARYYIIRAMVG